MWDALTFFLNKRKAMHSYMMLLNYNFIIFLFSNFLKKVLTFYFVINIMLITSEKTCVNFKI